MKIAYLSNSIIPSRTANSVHVMKMSQAFAQNGHHVTLYSKEGLETDSLAEDVYLHYGVKNIFNVERVRMKKIPKFGALYFAWKVRKMVKNDVPDIIYGRNILALAFTANIANTIIYEAHGIHYKFIRKLFEKIVFNLPNFKKLIVISDALKQDYLKEFPDLTKKEIVVAHDAADDPVCIEGKKEENREMMFSKAMLNVGYVGHLYPGRGVDLIVKIAEKMPTVKFHLIGGTEQDIEFWRVKSSKLGNVYFHGFVPNGELHSYYHQLDVLLAPYQNVVLVTDGNKDTSRWMSPMKIFEYMSYKKPIICSNIPVLNEVLKDRENCILCSYDNPCEWEDAIIELNTDKKFSESISRKAYNDFLMHYTWNGRAKKVLEGIDTRVGYENNENDYSV